MDRNAPANQRYIDQDELLPMLSVSPNTLRKWEKEGRFPKRTVMSTRMVRWWLPDVVDWLKDPNGWKPKQEAA
ncbi:MAG: AlpA family phage regulatory protein [Thiofilum sp.]|uniref:helix-turn-helix transcriptional regulator n=1 Tax=Thiofilum sp. TaxID=2212733 RepID=UPI0025D1D05A|nr:AlpA family phage regulatory protein [Thiofilum sp.]MBK8454108.1 AlpA family phage regulatory protein [Thiofilum sp.]